MKTYEVHIPVVMRLIVVIEAQNKEEAVEKAFNSDIVIDVKPDDVDIVDIDYEWDMYEKVVEGNVYYGLIHDVEVEEVEE